MSDGVTPVTIRILDKEYRIGCKDGERNSLLTCAHYVDEKMKEIRNHGKVVGIDRIAVMAALNIARELLDNRSTREDLAQTLSLQIQSLQTKIESALAEGRQMEL